MKVGLLIDLDGQRVWHRWLAEELHRLGHQLVIYRPDNGGHSMPPGLRLARWLDPIWYRLAGEHAFDTINPATVAERRVGEACSDSDLDILIDLAGSRGTRPRATNSVRVSFDGAATELAAIGPLLGELPVGIELDWMPASRREYVSPSVVRRECLTTSLDIVFSGLIELLADRIHHGTWSQAGDATRVASEAARRLVRPNAECGQHVSNLIRTKLARYLGTRSSAPGRWAIATRSTVDGHLFDHVPSRVATNARFNLVPDDRQRYYADPFLFSHRGKTHLFCEEYPLATRRGVVSVAEVTADGSIGSFRPVIERPYHVSYPFVFAHDGDVWMMPETCESGALELYRADRFPERWVLDRILIDNVRACDATIVKVDGQYLMILTATRWQGSTSDKQRVFCASSPLGPWTEHAAGLLRLDSRCARPAGAALRVGERLYRPAQDCSTRYGGAITLLEVQELSAAVCREVPVARVSVKGSDELVGTHTYSSTSSLEAVDVFGAVANVKTADLNVDPLQAQQGLNQNRARILGVSAIAT